jgi:radical SAM protein with 4Fe4S-binding SPASM domain
MLELMKKLGHAPRYAVWELTLRCNMDCRHCGSRAGEARSDELTLDEARQLSSDLADLGCHHLTLSGGEPLLRKDWPEIAESLVKAGIVTSIISNGSIWNDEIAQSMKRVGISTLGISVDGFRENHDYQRRRQGHFDRVIETIKSAVAAGIEVTAVTTINRRNQKELSALRDFLGECGASFWQVQFATPTGNMADNVDLMMEPRDVLFVVPLIAALCRDGKHPEVKVTHTVGYFGEPEEALRDPTQVIPFWTGCLAGMSVIGIESNGNIKGCLSLPSEKNGEPAFIEGNIRKQSLREIWTRPGAFAYSREFTVESLGGFCKTCEYAEVCRGGCTWSCYAGKGFVRDNSYCYFRQLHEEGMTEDERKVRLPVVLGG